MRTYQKVYAASASDAAVNNLIMWTSPIWLPIVLIVLPVYGWLTEDHTTEKPYCVNVEAEHQEAVSEMYAWHKQKEYGNFELWKAEKQRLEKVLRSGKCKKTPTL